MDRSVATVSAVIPTVGRPSLRDAVKSVADQSVPSKVIVVLDRLEMENEVRSLLADFDVTLVVQDSLGGAVARNAGIESAETKYVAFLDDDDTWLPFKTEMQLNAIRDSGSGPAFCGSSMVFVRQSDEIVVPRSRPPRSGIADYLVERADLRFGANAVQSSSLLVDRELAVDLMWSPLKKHQDWDFVIRAMQRPDVAFSWVDLPLVRVNQGSAESVSRTRRWHASAAFFEIHERQLSARNRADFLWVQIMRSALASGDISGVRYALARLRSARPHAAAMVVGASGAGQWLRESIARAFPSDARGAGWTRGRVG